MVTASYKQKIAALNTLVDILKKGGAKVSVETQNRLNESLNLNPQEVEKALTAPDPAPKSANVTH